MKIKIVPEIICEQTCWCVYKKEYFFSSWEYVCTLKTEEDADKYINSFKEHLSKPVKYA